MEWRDEGILLSVRRHGESSAVIEVLTAEHGRHAGLVHGGGGQKLGPVLQPGAQLALEWRARIEDHLGTYKIEPARSRAAVIMGDRGRLAGLNAMSAMILTTLPEREPDAAFYAETMTLADALADPEGPWPVAYARWELALLAALGFGLDLTRCAATGLRSDLAYVSPRTGRAVSRGAGAAYADRMLPLPGFLIGAAPPSMGGVREAVRLTGYFLENWILPAFDQSALPVARQRLMDMLDTLELALRREEAAPRDDEAEWTRSMGMDRELLIPGS